MVSQAFHVDGHNYCLTCSTGTLRVIKQFVYSGDRKHEHKSISIFVVLLLRFKQLIGRITFN